MQKKFRWHKAFAPVVAFLMVVGAAVYAQEITQMNQGLPSQIAIQAPAASDDAQNWTGETVYFGGVPWRVLESGEKLLLLSENMLRSDVAFDAKSEGASWENSTLRTVLNGENNQGGEETVLGTQFTKEEQDSILTTAVDTEGTVTQDKLFLLSVEEAQAKSFGFVNNESRAAQDGGQTDQWWWLRTPGYDGNDAANVYYDGSIDEDGYPTGYAQGGLRPAMYVDASRIAYAFRAGELADSPEGQDGWRLFLKGEEGLSGKIKQAEGQNVTMQLSTVEGYNTACVVMLDENQNKLGVQTISMNGEDVAVNVTPETAKLLVFTAKGLDAALGTGVASNEILLDLKDVSAESISTAPESTSTAPESTSTAPESTSTAPESASTAPESTSTAPESTSTAPESIPAAPESTPAAPESTPAAPESTSTAPESASTAPESASTASESTSTAPESIPAAPESTPAAPESTPAAPESTPAAPENTPAADTTQN